MKQTTLSTLVIRLFGLYLLYQTITYIFAGIVIPRTWDYFLDDFEGTTNIAIGSFATFAAMVVFCFLTIFKAKAVSCLLFRDEQLDIGEGRIDIQGWLTVGLKFLGVYIFVFQIPEAVPYFYDWLSVMAKNVQMELNDSAYLNQTVLQYALIFLMAGTLILKGSSISERLVKWG